MFFLSVNNDFLLPCGVNGLMYDLIFRVAALTKLPRAVIEESEELQVGTYKQSSTLFFSRLSGQSA